MDRIFKKFRQFLNRHPSLHSSSDEIKEIPVTTTASLEAITKESRSIKTNTVLSLPSAFAGETIPAVDPNNLVMSIVRRG